MIVSRYFRSTFCSPTSLTTWVDISIEDFYCIRLLQALQVGQHIFQAVSNTLHIFFFGQNGSEMVSVIVLGPREKGDVMRGEKRNGNASDLAAQKYFTTCPREFWNLRQLKSDLWHWDFSFE